MPKLTIAQLREIEVEKLARRRNKDPTENDLAQARRIMRSYYRLVALSSRNCELANDRETHDLPSTRESEEREVRLEKRLNKQLEEYSLTIYRPGIYPIIATEFQDTHGYRPEITLWLY